MKAINIKQPWAQLIARGIKKIEVRTWQTKHRGPLMIISSQAPDRDQIKATRQTNVVGAIFCTDVQTDELTGFYLFGSTICRVNLIKIEPFNASHIADACFDPGSVSGLFAWHFSNPEPVPPRKIKGRLGLFELSD